MFKNFSILTAAAILAAFVALVYWFGIPNTRTPVDSDGGDETFFADSIRLISPQSGEYIKGTLFDLEGEVNLNAREIFVKITDQDGKQASVQNLVLEKSVQGSWQSFSRRFNLKDHGGWMNIEIYASDGGDKLAGFKINLVRSI